MTSFDKITSLIFSILLFVFTIPTLSHAQALGNSDGSARVFEAIENDREGDWAKPLEDGHKTGFRSGEPTTGIKIPDEARFTDLCYVDQSLSCNKAFELVVGDVCKCTQNGKEKKGIAVYIEQRLKSRSLKNRSHSE
ncbi:MAG: hypothetical protein G3M78_04300 [Candidatus Nitrohelix vancouverensis]|uniref:Uncharacterized protein n=1 Tax=Candidatus Nitrohelix vancouverensis TaxID=2705534 RepID=A0A7T0C176_9BACT|nr:MAG: hypothetical protein G3M78_04300 [Candidatus Nitrohelix vancouverensis]